MEIEELLKTFQARIHGLDAHYLGAASPEEAFYVSQNVSHALIVDVRTQAEWNFVGGVPSSIKIEWQMYPSGHLNQDFLQHLQTEVPQDSWVMFLCRSGARSHAAANLAAQNGYTKAVNILEGFEGDKDNNGHRGNLGGWKFKGLPWYQG
jgi:rhodanese-related sulfurtransferase